MVQRVALFVHGVEIKGAHFRWEYDVIAYFPTLGQMCDGMAFHQEAILTSAVFKYIRYISSVPAPRSFRREQIISVSTSKLCITSSHFDTSNNSVAIGSCNVTTSFFLQKAIKQLCYHRGDNFTTYKSRCNLSLQQSATTRLN